MTSSADPTTLPPLTPDERDHSQAVTDFIRARIEAAGGVVPFETFMELALYAPGLGYYTAGGAKIGAGGDFTTAPEVSDLFSECVARQCSEVLAPGRASILELGAGTGRMAAAILGSLDQLDALPDEYLILEVSADLRARQEVRLGALPARLRERVRWLDSLPREPVHGVILANEVLDALPCHRVLIRDGEARTLGVANVQQAHERSPAFEEREMPADEQLGEEWRRIASTLPFGLPDGYSTELCPRVQPWIGSLADGLGSGAILLFDYGLPRAHYYHPQRTTGTLRCHFKQRAHDDPFIHVGVQDITTWVDFTRVAEAADAAGLTVTGFATQAAFLLGLGIEGLVKNPRLASEARQLLMPGEMGEAFKVMALTRGLDTQLSGFSVQDLRHSL